MNKFKVMVLAVLAGFFSAHTASAQNITIVSGNGQLVCQSCNYFAPLVVRVTDSNGAPLPNVTVNWAITSGGFGAGFLAGASTTTLSDGTTTNTYGYITQPPQGGPFYQYVQNTVTATTANASVATFSLSQALYDPSNPAFPAVYVTTGAFVQNLLEGIPLAGQAGTTGSTPIQVQVGPTRGGVIANVSLQLVNYSDPSLGPVVNCAGAAGGEPNTVLTDQNGLATCYPVFGGVPGTGKFYILVGAGGVVPADPTAVPFANFPIGNSGGLNVTVTPALPGLIKITQGNNSQSAAPGQTLGTPLQVEVDTAAGVPVAGQQVNWVATPASAINFAGSTATQTDVNGRTSETVTFSGSAAGLIQITATCPACPAAAKSVTFTVTAIIPMNVTGLQIVSGSNQTALVNTTFGLPLVVQVTANGGQPDTNANVQFSVSGPASLSSSSVPTNSSGQAQVSVLAGATAGPVTVTATVSSSSQTFTQTFSLTVTPAVPPPPPLTASDFYNGADFKVGSISPCSIASIIAPGLAPGIQGVVTPGSLFGPLPYLLASDAVWFNGTQAPIFNVSNVGGQQQITIQVPCEVIPSSLASVTVSVNGVVTTLNLPVLAASPGIFETVMSDGVARAVAVRPDGSFVSLTNPARRGETIRAYATGLGVTLPSVGTNATAIPGTDAIVQGNLIMGVTNTAGQGEGVRVSNARVAPDLIGVFEIPFQMPSDAATGNNVRFSIGVIPAGASAPNYSMTATIPIQ